MQGAAGAGSKVGEPLEQKLTDFARVNARLGSTVAERRAAVEAVAEAGGEGIAIDAAAVTAHFHFLTRCVDSVGLCPTNAVLKNLEKLLRNAAGVEKTTREVTATQSYMAPYAAFLVAAIACVVWWVFRG